ncbi:(4Fe-4S)-binding protein, partial [bacterium]|nr:(4Fe-4S)-binding protein [bacterium]
MDRFEGAPKEMDPRYIFPDAKVMICLAFRIPRGYLRGIEEGTHFYQYPAMGYAGINEVYAPMVLREVSCFIEDQGYEGAVYRNTGGRGPVSDMTGAGPTESPEMGRRLSYFEPVSPDKPAPDVQFHFRIAAYVCGMGEIGYSKVFLTPEFGPRQRFAFIMTDAPLEPDPIYDGRPLCDRCMSCVTDCPGKAISRD